MDFLTPILIAVAMVSVPGFIGWYYKRKLQVERLMFKCETLLNHTVVNNENLSDPFKVDLLEKYENSKRSQFEMIFSTKPVKITSWFSKEQQDTFFNHDFEFREFVFEELEN